MGLELKLHKLHSDAHDFMSFEDLANPPPLAKQNETLRFFLNALREQSLTPVVGWPSSILMGDTVTKRKISQIVDSLFSTTALRHELDNFDLDFKRLGPSAFWDAYLSAYDRVIGFSDGYLDIAIRASSVLPAKGRIAEFGVGTGNILSILALLEPQRQVLGLDFSVKGIELAQNKFRLLTSDLDLLPAEFVVQDVVDYQFVKESLDGAIMNNFLYAISPSERLGLFRRIFSALKKGGVLVVNDPNRYLQSDKLGLFMKSSQPSS